MTNCQLQNWRLQPRKEALVRLRYARTLFEETENVIEAETTLSKGVSLLTLTPQQAVVS